MFRMGVETTLIAHLRREKFVKVSFIIPPLEEQISLAATLQYEDNST